MMTATKPDPLLIGGPVSLLKIEAGVGRSDGRGRRLDPRNHDRKGNSMTPSQDEAAIRSLICFAALTTDEGPLDDYDRVYVEEATWRLADQDSQHGLAAIKAAAAKRRGQGTSGP